MLPRLPWALAWVPATSALRQCALMATTTITRTRALPTDTMDLTGSPAESSLAPDRGSMVITPTVAIMAADSTRGGATMGAAITEAGHTPDAGSEVEMAVADTLRVDAASMPAAGTHPAAVVDSMGAVDTGVAAMVVDTGR